MKATAFLLVNLCCLFSGKIYCQVNPVYFPKYEYDERPMDLVYDDSSQSYLMLMLRANKPVNPGNYSLYLDYDQILYRFDQNYTIIDSVYFSLQGANKIMLNKILKAGIDSILISSNVLDTITFEEKPALFWLNENLDVIKDTIYNFSYTNKPVYFAILNNAGNIVFAQGFPMYNTSGTSASLLEFASMMGEVDQSGNLLQLKYDTCNSCYMGQFFESNDGTGYLMNFTSAIIKYTPDFTLDTLFLVDCENCEWTSNLNFSSDRLILGCEIPVFQPPPIVDLDVVLFQYSSSLELLNVSTFGVPDTIDRYPVTSDIIGDKLLVAYTKNETCYPCSDTWLNLEFVNINNETNYWSASWGGYGVILTWKILSLENFKFLVVGTVWDFHQYPNDYQNDAFMIKVDLSMYSGITGNQKTEAANPVSLNPFNDILNIDIPGDHPFHIRVFDLSGRVVYEGWSNDKEINLGYIESGIYFCSIVSDEEYFWKGKIIKM